MSRETGYLPTAPQWPAPLLAMGRNISPNPSPPHAKGVVERADVPRGFCTPTKWGTKMQTHTKLHIVFVAHKYTTFFTHLFHVVESQEKRHRRFFLRFNGTHFLKTVLAHTPHFLTHIRYTQKHTLHTYTHIRYTQKHTLHTHTYTHKHTLHTYTHIRTHSNIAVIRDVTRDVTRVT